jgi:hypothetical protein
MHGGASTGPVTPAGLAHSAQANWKHGFRSQKANEEAKLLQDFLRECKDHYKALSSSGW